MPVYWGKGRKMVDIVVRGCKSCSACKG